MSDIKTKLVLESVDTDSLSTATVMRLVFEGPPNTVQYAAELVIDGLNATVTRATNVMANGEQQDITSAFVSEQIDPLDTGDTAGK